jgi:hypothetical protein
MAKPKNSFRIEVFRSGTFTPMVGDAISYSADDLAGIVETYDPDSAPAPVVIGHPTTDAPAYGWVSGFEYDADADLLYADIGDLEPAFATAVQDGRYKKVSMSFHMPGAPNNPTPGKWHAKHVGFLGGAAPAVSGLKPVQFSQGAEGEVATFEAEFGEAGFEDAASLFRGMRDFFIEKFGLETADNILPNYRIDWLSEREITPSLTSAPLFVAPSPKGNSMTEAEIAAAEADLATRQAALTAREATFSAGEIARRGAANVAFAESLITEGKILPASKDQVVAILDAMPADQAVSFAEGESAPLGDALKAFLTAQPKAVAFGATDMGDDPGDLATDPTATARFATAYQNEQATAGIHISISEAVEHVSKGAAK